MPRVFWVNSLARLAVALAVLAAATLVLLWGPPWFTNAARPPRFGDPVLALQFARGVEDVELILSDAPSLDREVMRIKQYIDFAFVAFYVALFATLSALAVRKGGWRQVAGVVAGICGLAAGVFDVLENRAILNLLDVPLRATTAGMIQAIRGASVAKWVLAGVTVALLSVSFLRIPKTS